MRTRQELPAFIFVEVNTREYRKLVLKLRRGAMNVWRKVQQLHEAMRHIFDNDTSGFSGQFRLTHPAHPAMRGK